MSDTKISALLAASSLADTDELVIASSGASKKITGASLKASVGGGGIKFGTNPQAGGWLYVETTDDTGSPHGWGIELNSQDDDGIWIHSDNRNVRIEAAHWVTLHGTSLVELDSESTIGINAPTVSINAPASFQLNINGSNKISWLPGAGSFHGFLLDSEGGYLHMDGSGIRMQTPVGRPISIVSQGNYLNMSAAGSITLSGMGADGAVMLMAGLNPYGQAMMYNCIGVPGTYGTFPVAGHFFMLEGGQLYGAGDVYASYFEVRDYWTAAPLLRITRAAGGAISFHMKSGAAWVADL